MGPPAAERLSAAQARHLALEATGLLRGPLARPVTRADLAGVVARLGAVQIDSVSVTARAHLVPFYSRLGPYDPAVLDRALTRRPVAGVEYWAHEASLVHPPLLVAFKWRMARAAEEAWGGMAAVGRRRPELLDAVLGALRAGPRTGRQLQALLEPGGPRPREHWGWNWSDVKHAVEWLFWSGQVTSAGRTAQFERRYALPAQVWPANVLDAPVPDEADAVAALVAHAAAATGVATASDLRDHFRLPLAATAAAVARLAADGVLTPVEVEGWGEPAWRHAGARVPSARAAREARRAPTTLVSPFDPVVWTRRRTQRLFGFDYRIEIYVPREQRRHGYYVLPFLMGGRPRARVDLRADRAAGVLEVPAAWVEDGAPPGTPAALARELTRYAAWLGLERVGVPGGGDLAADLAAALGAHTPAVTTDPADPGAAVTPATGAVADPGDDAVADADAVVTHDPQARRFTLAVGEERVGLLDYEAAGTAERPVWHLTHTVVRRDMRNRGLASELVREVMAAARSGGVGVRPVCPYVVTWLRRNPGHDDLVV